MPVILLKGAALLLGLFIVELLSRLFFWYDPQLHYKVNSSAAWRIAWVARQNAGIAIYRPGIDQFDALLGWRNRPGFRNEQPILGSRIVRTNSKGVRGIREHHYARTDQHRILVIGDSFAFGWGVSDGDTYSAQLEAALPHTEVLNLGVGGYGTDQMLLMLETEGTRYRPDLVIVGVVSADTDRNLVSFRDFAKPLFILDGESLRLKATTVASPEDWLSRAPASQERRLPGSRRDRRRGAHPSPPEARGADQLGAVEAHRSRRQSSAGQHPVRVRSPRRGDPAGRARGRRETRRPFRRERRRKAPEPGRGLPPAAT